MVMSKSGWEQLNCQYFANVCRRVLGALLGAQGFAERGLTPGGGVIFSKGDVALELNYDVSRYPRYFVTAWLSLGDWVHRGNGVPLWYMLSNEHPYREGTHWNFHNEEELFRVLSEVKADFVEAILIPLLDSQDALERLIDRFRRDSAVGKVGPGQLQ